MDFLSIATSVASQGSYAVLSFFVGYLLNKECEEVETEYSENVIYTFLTNDEKVLNRIEELTSGQKALFIATKAIQISVK